LALFFSPGSPLPPPPPPFLCIRRPRFFLLASFSLGIAAAHTPPSPFPPQNPNPQTKQQKPNSTGPKQYLPRLLTSGVDEAAARQAADKARAALNVGLGLGGRVLSGEDASLSLRAAALLFLAARVGRVITPVGLLYLAVLALFTLPKAYELRKDEFDRAHDTVRRQAEAVAAQARQQVGDVVSRLTPRKAAAAAGGGGVGKAE
jgi:hypothetical protein